jgi:hypothetical protein
VYSLLAHDSMWKSGRLNVSEKPAASIFREDVKAVGSSAMLLPTTLHTSVEAGSNTSTLTLQVVRGDEMGLKKGRTIAYAVSRWLPTAAVRGSRPGLSCGILWWTKSSAGVGFLRVLRFPLPIFIPPIAPKIIIYHRGLYNRPKWLQYRD